VQTVTIKVLRRTGMYIYIYLFYYSALDISFSLGNTMLQPSSAISDAVIRSFRDDSFLDGAV
jgi:hypothetical protein